MNEFHSAIHFQSGWKDLEALSPSQNRWLRIYTKPPVTVVLEAWIKQLPEGFSLEQLLEAALKAEWKLTEAGWEKAEKIGLLQRYEASPNPEDSGQWLTQAEAVKQLLRYTDGAFSEGSLKARLSRHADNGKLETNGESGRKRRYSVSGINALEIALRNKCLEDDGDEV